MARIIGLIDKVCSDARPPAPDTPNSLHKSGSAAKHLDMAGLIGQLGG